jgi:alpha-L-rhamnosidase
MSGHQSTRRRVTFALLAAPLWAATARAAGALRKPITEFGAVADDKTVNTRAIQAAIDHVAAQGGGTVVVPAGTFVSGALFFKPGAHLHLDKGAVLKCSLDMANFPPQRTRIEGHFEDSFTPALINAAGCDGFHLTGEGTLDGDGFSIWERFWKERNASPDKGNYRNIAIPRARLALIERSKGVVVDGVTFKDSQFWNLHIYRCQDVTVKNARFQVPDDYRQAPSTDGIDLDSCQNVLVEGCYFSVTDDCIAAKGSKGPFALQDKDSPPVEHVRVRNCTFKRGNGVLTLGSEATIVKDIVVEDCHIVGNVKIATLKLRPDTPQHYEDIHFRNITSDDSSALMIEIKPWSQYKDLKGEAPPKSIVKNVTLTNVKGRYGKFGTIAPNPGQTTISDIVLKDFDVQLKDPKPDITGVTNLRVENVVVNGKPFKATD